MELKAHFIQSAGEVFQNYKLKLEFKQEVEGTFLATADDINVVISVTQPLKGNIVIGLNKLTAHKIVSLITGEKILTFAESDLELLNQIAILLANLVSNKVQPDQPVKYLTPMLVLGEDVHLMINRIKADKLLFQLESDLLSVAYSIEQ